MCLSSGKEIQRKVTVLIYNVFSKSLPTLDIFPYTIVFAKFLIVFVKKICPREYENYLRHIRTLLFFNEKFFYFSIELGETPN